MKGKKRDKENDDFDNEKEYQDDTLSLCMPFLGIFSSEHNLPNCSSRGCR